MLSKIQTLELSHQLFMWHRWRVAIRSQAMGLGDLRCCTVASGNFEKQYPEMRGENPYWKHKFEVSQSVCLSVVQIKISLSLYVKAMCVCTGCVELQNFCSAPSFRTTEAPVHSLYGQIPVRLHIHALLFVSILRRSHLHAKSTFRHFGEFSHILVLKG